MKKLIATLAAIMIMVPAMAMAQDTQTTQQTDRPMLTDQQLEQLHTMQVTQHKQMIKLRADLETAKLEMAELMRADKVDNGKVLKKGDEISALKAQMAKIRLQGRLDRMNILTDEQRAQMRKDRMHRGPGHGKRGGGRPMMRNDGQCPFGNDGPQGQRPRMFNRFGDAGPDDGGYMADDEEFEIEDDFADMSDF
jgi:Spy/CpxP family protein refolding chaperone